MKQESGKATVKTVPLGLAEDLYATIPRRHYNDLKAVITVDKKITAPVKEGDKAWLCQGHS